jgi:hypothetical protein
VSGSFTFDAERPRATCDNQPGSPFLGTCYVVIDGLSTYASTDGGRTWALASDPGFGSRPVIAVRPDGRLVLADVDTDGDDRVVVRVSDDGGATWSDETVVAPFADRMVFEDLAVAQPRIELQVDAAGRTFLVWSACTTCADPDRHRIWMSTSDDGVAWSPAVAITPDDALERTAPALATDPSSAGLAVTWYEMHHDCGTECELDVVGVHSTDGGASWTDPVRLNERTMQASWFPGLQVFDRTFSVASVTWVGGRPLATLGLAHEKVDGEFRIPTVAVTGF